VPSCPAVKLPTFPARLQQLRPLKRFTDEPVVHVMEELVPIQEEIDTLVNEIRAFWDEVGGIEASRTRRMK